MTPAHKRVPKLRTAGGVLLILAASAYDYDYPEPTGHLTGASVHPPTPGGYPAPGATPATVPPGYPPPPAAQPSRWRWLRYAAIGVAALIGASITTYHSAHRASEPQPSVPSLPTMPHMIFGPPPRR